MLSSIERHAQLGLCCNSIRLESGSSADCTIARGLAAGGIILKLQDARMVSKAIADRNPAAAYLSKTGSSCEHALHQRQRANSCWQSGSRCCRARRAFGRGCDKTKLSRRGCRLMSTGGGLSVLQAALERRPNEVMLPGALLRAGRLHVGKVACRSLRRSCWALQLPMAPASSESLQVGTVSISHSKILK